MTTFSDHFNSDAVSIAPQPWMQLRPVASAEAASVSRNYDPSDGVNKSDLVQTVEVSWTNTTPMTQSVYGLLTKSGSQVTLQCRSRGYLSTRQDIHIGTDTPVFDLIEVSRFGVGSDLGNGGLLNLGGAYAISELRQNSVTAPFMPHVAEWFLVPAGETITGRVEVVFVSESWEGTQIDGGDGDTESKIVSGDLRLDLFAVPSETTVTGRAIPSFVGAVEWDRETDIGFGGTTTEVDVPAGVAEGDVLLAVVCNNLGLEADVGPVESGWSLLHDRNAAILGGTLDVHMRVYVRTATASEPATYSFTNALLSEQTSVLIALRDAATYTSSLGQDWHAASSVSSYRLVETHLAPSIDRKGQLLLCFSFFAHTPLQSPITQTPPYLMTELADLPGAGTTLAIAYLMSPPTPTLERQFYPSALPVFSGHSITATILVPGKQV